MEEREKRKRNPLFGFEKHLAQQFWHHAQNPFVTQKHIMIPQQFPPRFVRLKLALELLDANDAGDELDVMLGEEIFVLTLGVFGEETDGGCRRRRESRMRQLTREKVTGESLVSCRVLHGFPTRENERRKPPTS